MKTLFIFLFVVLQASYLSAAIVVPDMKDHQKHGFSQTQLLNSKQVSASMHVFSAFDKVSPLMGQFPVRIYIENPLNENISGKLVSSSQSNWDSGKLKKEFSKLPFHQIKRGYIDILLPQQPSKQNWQRSLLRFIGENSNLNSANFRGSVHPVAVTSQEPLLIDRLRKEMVAGLTGYRRNEQEQLAILKFDALTNLEDQFQGWKHLVIHQDELDKLKEPSKKLLTRSFELFLKRGGDLWVKCSKVDAMSLPKGWSEIKQEELSSENKKTYLIGQGRVHLTTDKNITWAELSKHRDHFFDARSTLLMKIPDIQTNILGFMLMVFGFALLVGPLNLFVFCKGNRIKLMVTTPLISLIAVIVFGVCILMIEGVGGEGARESVTYIDIDRHEHITRTSQASRTGVVLSSRFILDENATIWPTVAGMGKPKNSRASSEYSQNDQQMVGGWFTSRNIQIQTITSRKLNRERLELKNENGQLKILSTMSVKLDYVWTYNQKGEVVGAKDVRSGSEREVDKLNQHGDPYLLDQSLRKLIQEYQRSGQEVLLAISSTPHNPIKTYDGIDWTWNRHCFIVPVKLRKD
jgi:hypothetical protein